MSAKDSEFRLGIQRFGLGAAPSARAEFGSDIRAALLAEISPEAARISRTDLPTTARGIQIITEIEDRVRERREAARKIAQETKATLSASATNNATAPNAMPGEPAGNMMAAPMPDPDEIRARDVLNDEFRARFEQAVAARTGFAERWVGFWSNHFCVALRRGRIMNGVSGPYEREAIRAHAFGRFEDMLIAVETHPAMLHYLDQRQSIGPNSPAGKRRQKGLNENLAREILELHTLGVGGGYSQNDVTSFAKALTGWSISGFEENIDGYGGFVFAANRHEPGARTLLGKTYADDGKEQGLAILRDLARHPSTAKFIATKLARHFVGDAPSAALVGRLESDFGKSGGNLGQLARTLLTAPEAWLEAPPKLRTPYEFVVATLRATDEKPEKLPQLVNALNLLGQPLWNPAGPNGHADDATTLIAPKAMKTRLEYAIQAGRQIANRHDPRELAEALYGTALSTETKTAIARAESRPQGLALLFMSPEFQRR